MNTPTPEERADEIERLLLKVCAPGEMYEALTATAEAVRLAWQDGYRAAVAAEREACARVAEGGAWEPVIGKDYYETVDVPGTARAIANAIRARGKT